MAVAVCTFPLDSVILNSLCWAELDRLCSVLELSPCFKYPWYPPFFPFIFPFLFSFILWLGDEAEVCYDVSCPSVRCSEAALILLRYLNYSSARIEWAAAPVDYTSLPTGHSGTLSPLATVAERVMIWAGLNASSFSLGSRVIINLGFIVGKVELLALYELSSARLNESRISYCSLIFKITDPVSE